MTDHGSEDSSNREALLVEYQASQDSAQHHDQLVWSITSILWASSLVLLGLVLTAMRQPGLQCPLTIVGSLAIVLNLYLWLCAWQMRNVKVQKYRRCVAIEKQLGLVQHTELHYPRGIQTAGYAVVMILFLVVWAVVIAFVWMPA
jgi:hypothetical protein